jgi:hypothetical protein
MAYSTKVTFCPHFSPLALSTRFRSDLSGLLLRPRVIRAGLWLMRCFPTTLSVKLATSPYITSKNFLTLHTIYGSILIKVQENKKIKKIKKRKY